MRECVVQQYTRAKMVIVGQSKGAARSRAEPGPGKAANISQTPLKPRNAALGNLMLPIWTIKEIFVVRSWNIDLVF